VQYSGTVQRSCIVDSLTIQKGSLVYILIGILVDPFAIHIVVFKFPCYTTITRHYRVNAAEDGRALLYDVGGSRTLVFVAVYECIYSNSMHLAALPLSVIYAPVRSCVLAPPALDIVLPHTLITSETEAWGKDLAIAQSDR
jgi:hypothetical protein